MHFYNVPIAPGTDADPLLTIGQVAQPEDFVVFKLDIDTFNVERDVSSVCPCHACSIHASFTTIDPPAHALVCS
jgi:hypothetical protein